MLSMFNSLFIMMLVWGLFNFIIYVFKIQKVVKEHKDDPNVKGVKIVNGQVQIIEADKAILEAKIKEEIKDLVVDPVCNAQVEKTQAYHLIQSGESHYFCSWDCREKFLKPESNEHL